MKRREFMRGSAVAVTALHAANVRAATLLPCINQVTTLEAAFDAECAPYHDAGFRHVELWFGKLKELGLARPAIAARLRDAALTPVCACAAGSFLWRGVPGPVERRGELEGHFALAEALGVPRFVIFDHVDTTPKRDDYAVAAERLASVAGQAAKYGVRIALGYSSNEYFDANGRLIPASVSTDYPAYCKGSNFSARFGSIPTCTTRFVTIDVCTKK